MAPRLFRRPLSSLLVMTAPLALGAVLVAKDAPAGPPGPWVWIPPPGGAASTAGSTAATSTPVGSAAPSTSGSAAKEDGMARTQRAVVVVERDKKPVALGVLLNERSVILTARSAVVASTTGELEIRYPDVGPVKAKLVHEDAAWDLALLVPASTKGIPGAQASFADPLAPTATFHTFVLLKTGKTQPQATPVLGKRDYLSPDGQTLKDALTLDPTKAIAIGTPLVDANGGVVAMVTRACAPGAAGPTSPTKPTCVPTLFGVPLSQVRAFLKSAPANARAPSAWLGIVGLTESLGVRIVAIDAGSPAATAGLKAGDASSADTVIAVDSELTRTAESLNDAIKKHSPGDVVTLLVASGGRVRDVKVTLKGSDDAISTPPSPKPTSTTTSSPSVITFPLPPLPIPTVYKPK
jgi:S1-C subfamily serine protease